MQCSLVDLTWGLDLYNHFEALTEGFHAFLDHCHKHLSGYVGYSDSWTTITNAVYVPRTTPKGKIRTIVHRFIHKLITFSINQKKEGDRVPIDLFFV